MKILVDADACPREALRACLELGKEYKLPVWTVASFNHVIESDHHIVVGNGPDEADLKLANLSEKGDVAVTQDWGLVAILLARGVHCLHPLGTVFQHDKIDLLLEERALKAKFRRGGGRTKGPAKRRAEDDQRFYRALERVLQHPSKLGEY